MKISWNSIKVSIAGARLSHLVQKDKLWDHGSMVEQVKTVYRQLQKATINNNPELVRGYMTIMCYKICKKEYFEFPSSRNKSLIYPESIEVLIVAVRAGKNQREARFEALIKKRKTVQSIAGIEHCTKNSTLYNYREHWSFVRNGDWWLLDATK